MPPHDCGGGGHGSGSALGRPPPARRLVLRGRPFLAVLTAYDYHYFGHPLAFGQTVVAAGIALSKTGTADLWQSSWSESLAGLLISPARGLVRFSLVPVLGVVSAAAVWRNPRYRAAIPPRLGTVLMRRGKPARPPARRYHTEGMPPVPAGCPPPPSSRQPKAGERVSGPPINHGLDPQSPSTRRHWPART